MALAEHTDQRLMVVAGPCAILLMYLGLFCGLYYFVGTSPKLDYELCMF